MHIYDYELDPIGGILYLKGRAVGYKKPDGYIDVRVGGSKRQKLHRMIYQWVYGTLPDDLVIDHIDNNRANNQPWNLQAVSNRVNTTKDQQPNSGHHHICVMPNGKYRVQIKGYLVKRFVSIEDALIYRQELLDLIRTEEEGFGRSTTEVSDVFTLSV